MRKSKPNKCFTDLSCLFAANCIISTSELKGVPRNEATTIVGTLLAFPPVVKDLPLLLPSKNELTLISSAEVKDQIIGVLLKSGKKEPAGLARCISLSSLGIFVYSELLHESFHPKIKEAIQVTKKEESIAILIHQKLGFTDTDLAENFNLADNIATTDVFYLLIAETSILRTVLG